MTSVLYRHPLNFFGVLFPGSAIVKRRAPIVIAMAVHVKRNGFADVSTLNSGYYVNYLRRVGPVRVLPRTFPLPH